MKSRTQQQWRELFKQQAAGELSVATFCKQYGISQTPIVFFLNVNTLIISYDVYGWFPITLIN